MPDAVSRFGGFAAHYDDVRPTPPDDLVPMLLRWAGLDRGDLDTPPGQRSDVASGTDGQSGTDEASVTDAPSESAGQRSVSAPEQSLTVVDLGAGTGLSTAVWGGWATEVVAVEPSPGMRELAEPRLRAAAGEYPRTRFRLLAATAEATGLPDGCADVVTVSQALHWFDPARALPEAARLLRPGGVFAAYDCDWPPGVDAEVDAAYTRFDATVREEEIRRGMRPPYAAKQGHLRRLRESGLFRYATEMCLHKDEPGDAERLIGIALSQGGVPVLLGEGMSEDALGITELRAVAARRLPTARPWWWTYRARLAVR